MNLKQGLLAELEAEQLKELCAELELEADRRSRDAMVDALSGARRAKPELIILKLTVVQLRAVLQQFEQSTRGSKEELVRRLLAEDAHESGDHVTARARVSSSSDMAAEYRHSDQAVQRPDAGVQDQFQAKKPPSVVIPTLVAHERL